jgi:hypothetical protein
MRKQGLFQALMLAGTLAAGFGTVWGVLAVWMVQVGEHVAGVERPAETLFFLKDGTPRVFAADTGDRQYFDLEHRPVSPPADDMVITGVERLPLPASMPIRARWRQHAWDQRIRWFTDMQSPAVNWYFCSDGRPDGLGYFVGYDSKNNACVGFLGLAGIRAEPLSAEEMIPFGGDQKGREQRVFNAFQNYDDAAYPMRIFSIMPTAAGSVSPWDVYIFGRDNRLYHADLRKQTVDTVLDGLVLRSVGLGNDCREKLLLVPVVRTHDAVMVLEANGWVKKRFPIPDALRGRDLEFVATTGDGVLCWHSPRHSLATEVDYHIFWVSPNGSTREAKTTLRWTGDSVNQPVLLGVEVPVPAVALGSIAIQRPRELLEHGMATTYEEALGRAVSEYRPTIAIAVVVSFALAVLCYRRQVRYGARGVERVVWPMFVLVCGLPGWIGYRFGRAWPLLDTCPTCHAAVPRDRADCLRCAADFPGPVLKGTEVFA